MSALLPRTTQVIEEGIAKGLHLGAQICASIAGQTVADLTWGQSRPGVAMSSDTLMLWLSGTKPIVAVALAMLWEKGKLNLDDRIADHIPNFASGGKDAVTIRHVLTHTCGFRWVETGWPKEDWDSIITRICKAEQERDWVVGRTAGYSPYASWFLLGEIVRRLDGRDIGRFVRAEIFVPLGMADSWLAMPADAYHAYGSRIGIMHKTTWNSAADAGLDTEAAAGSARPSGGARGPAKELARFYEMLRNGGALNSTRILLPQTVEAMTARHRVGIKDLTFNHVIDWGLGFLINSNQYGEETIPYSYGPYASPRTFGHGGSQSSASFCDPESQLAAAVVFNGMPGEPAHQKRIRATLKALYEDLGIAGDQ